MHGSYVGKIWFMTLRSLNSVVGIVNKSLLFTLQYILSNPFISDTQSEESSSFYFGKRKHLG